jgi:hypothetical protein
MGIIAYVEIKQNIPESLSLMCCLFISFSSLLPKSKTVLIRANLTLPTFSRSTFVVE